MSLSRRASKKSRNFNFPVSYRLYEARPEKLVDALNVFTLQNTLQTRPGSSRFNSNTLGGPVLSVSYFKSTAGVRYRLVKVGTVLYSVNDVGVATSIKTGLSSSTKHRGKTVNNRHVVAIESDGLFSFDGTTFTALGQAAPSAVSVAAAGGGSLADGTWTVKVTFYSSSFGFESNGSASSSIVTTGAGSNKINVSGIDATAANGFIDKVRIYLRDEDANSAYNFITEQAIGLTTYTILDESTSTFIVPTTNSPPIAGGGKYLAEFGGALVYAGNSTYKNDIFFAGLGTPDSIDQTITQTLLHASGDGDVTGLGTGFYNNASLDPYLVIFKKRQIYVYSNRASSPKFVCISEKIGCVSHDTIQVINGNVVFLSESGWRIIVNGKMIEDLNQNPITLGASDIDDIFRSRGFVYELNKSNMSNFFSVYYGQLNQYMTWVSEGSDNTLRKTYVYEIDSSGFKPYSFYSNATCGCSAEDASGNEVVLFGDANGFLYSHSIQEDRSDYDSSGAAKSIPAFALLSWIDGEDSATTYNFRDLILRATASSNTLTVKAFVNFNLQDVDNYSFDFTDPNSGFILDVSLLDEGVFSDGRTVVSAKVDINRSGESLLVGFYQDIINSNMNLVSAQLDFSKNKNRN